MRSTEPKTPLIELLRDLTDEQRHLFAKWSQTPLTYLYALGGCSRKACRSDKAVLIAQATQRLNKRFGTRVITVEELATMCACVNP
jgi:hypothetical protein